MTDEVTLYQATWNYQFKTLKHFVFGEPVFIRPAELGGIQQVSFIKFFRQYSIGPYIIDFYCPTVKLAVELDGGHHNQSDNREYDAARSEYLKTQGIDVMRFWDNEVLLDIQSVLSKLALKVTPLYSPPSQGNPLPFPP